MVILPECRADEVRHVLTRVDGLSITYEGRAVPCRFSRGWVDYVSGETVQELMKRADDASMPTSAPGNNSEPKPLYAVLYPPRPSSVSTPRQRAGVSFGKAPGHWNVSCR